MIAHELGHAKHHDVLLGTLLGVGGQRRCGGAAGPGARRPAGASARAGVRGRRPGRGGPGAAPRRRSGRSRSAPLQNTVSRAIEARADRTSIEVTHADRTFVQMQRRLALTSLADPTPPALSQLWWGSHPTVLQRAGLPRSLREADGEPRPGRDQRLPDPPRRDRVVRARAVRGDAARRGRRLHRLDAGRAGVRRRARVPGLPGPVLDAAADAAGGPPGRRGDAAARLRPGGVRGQLPARSARAGAAPGRGRAGSSRSRTATRCGGPRCRSPGRCSAGSATRSTC